MSRFLRAWAPTVAAVLVVALTVSLGNWQTRRADEKRTLQAQRDRAQRSEAIDITASSGEAPSLDGQRVRVRGRFVSESDVFIDNRTYRGVAGFHVVSPLRITGTDSHLLVLRGWVAGDPRMRWRAPKVPASPDEVVIEGVAMREFPRTLELGEFEPGPGDRIWFNVDLPRFERWSGLSMRSPIVREMQAALTLNGPFDDGLVRDWPRPGNDVDRHVAYAFQWYAMATLAAGLWLWFVAIGHWRRLRRTRDAAGTEKDSR